MTPEATPTAHRRQARVAWTATRRYVVACLAGNGIGPEVMAEASRALAQVSRLHGFLVEEVHPPFAGEALVIRAGERNARLFALACALRRYGLGPRALHTCLVAVNDEHVQPPVPAAEVARIVASASRYPIPADPVTSRGSRPLPHEGGRP